MEKKLQELENRKRIKEILCHQGDPVKFIDYTFKRGLYDIAPIIKNLDKKLLTMAYSPGVGAVCMAIKDKPELTDKYTLRGRSVAIVTQGSFSEQHQFQLGLMPVMLDWCIAQAKYYGGIDCFPFIIRKQANLQNVLKDLANVYSVILWFDHKKYTGDIPKDVAFVELSDIINQTKDKKTDWYNTSKILGHIVQQKIRGGRIDQQTIINGLDHCPNLFYKSSFHAHVFKDGRSLNEHALQMHEQYQGKIQIQLTFSNIQQIKYNYTEENIIKYIKQGKQQKGYKKLSTIITDGTAVLGYGNIGPRAGLPVMEGKSFLFKALGGVDVVPLAINRRQSTKQAVEAILDLAYYFKAVNLEDIKAPQCFTIEKELSAIERLPIFHDDQHGTAIVMLAALINAAKVAKKQLKDCKVVINGAGAAGMTIAKLLVKYGIKNVIVADTKCAIYQGRKQHMNPQKQELSKITNPHKIQGCLNTLLENADVFIGVSVKGALKKEDVKKMAENSIIFAAANPDPEITLEDALEGGAFIYGSGRSDYKNQINNSLVFPGIFRALHKHDLKAITDQMKLSTAKLIAQGLEIQPTRTFIIPDCLDQDVPVIICEGLGKYKDNE